MAKKHTKKSSARFSNKMKLAQIKLKNMTKTKRLYFFIFLAVCVLSIILCITGVVIVGIEQSKQLQYLNELRDSGNLYTVIPALAPATDLKPEGAWYAKGIEAYSWYLTSTYPLGAVGYWFTVIFAFIAFPTLTYYISSFMIVCFPHKDKKPKNKKKSKKQSKQKNTSIDNGDAPIKTIKHQRKHKKMLQEVV